MVFPKSQRKKFFFSFPQKMHYSSRPLWYLPGTMIERCGAMMFLVKIAPFFSRPYASRNITIPLCARGTTTATTTRTARPKTGARFEPLSRSRSKIPRVRSTPTPTSACDCAEKSVSVSTAGGHSQRLFKLWYRDCLCFPETREGFSFRHTLTHKPA